MTERRRAILASALAGCCITLAVRAQRELDVHPHAIHRPHVVGKSGTGRVSVGSMYDGFRDLEVPFDRLGDFAFTLGGRVLVCGRDRSTDPPRGILIAAEPKGRGFQVLGSYAEVGADFVGVAWDRATSQLYLLDAASGRILTAPHGARNAPPQQWKTVLTAAECPLLGAAEDFVLDVVHEDGALVGFRLAHYSDSGQPMLEDVHIVRVDGGTARTESHGGYKHGANITDHHLTVGQTEIEVLGPPAARVAVAQVFDKVILGRGTTDAHGKALLVVTPLTAGHVFHAVNLDHPDADGTYSSALYRWGESEIMPNGQRLPRFDDVLGLRASVGNSTFSVSLRLGDCEHVGWVRGQTFRAVLAVGIRDGVTRVGEHIVLRPLATMQTDARILENGRGSGVVRLPIPDRAELAGAVVAFQWWVFAAPDDVRVSEVAATVIGDPWAPPGSEAFFGLDRPARGFTGERPWNVWSRAALDPWLAEHSAADTSDIVDRVFALLRK